MAGRQHQLHHHPVEPRRWLKARASAAALEHIGHRERERAPASQRTQAFFSPADDVGELHCRYCFSVGRRRR